MITTLAEGARLLRTIGHLRARQLLHLAWHRLRPARRPVAPPSAWSRARADRVGAALVALGPVSGTDAARTAAAAWLDGRLHCLGLDVPWSGDWRMPGPSPLWRFHLHYHDHLADLAWTVSQGTDPRAAARLTADLEGWMGTWGAGGSPAWDAYPVSVRLVNWIRILAWAGPSLPEGLRGEIERGVAVHTAHLARTLEWHLDGNHLLRNVWALALGSSCLEGAWATGARSDAQRLFDRLMREQILPDGWHMERSPMYHLRALRDAIEVEATRSATGETLDAATTSAIDRMSNALPWMLRADGSAWLLNDSTQDHGVALGPLLARRPQSTPPQGVRHFREASIVALIDGGDRLRLDLGAPAPAHQPAHAHAGALGFELDLDGVPTVVDSGCAGYDGDPWRPYLRGTRAHSTVVIDGSDQSEMWATFRVGGRATVSTVSVEGAEQDLIVRAECRAFHTPASVQQRTYRREGRRVTVADRIVGSTPVSADAYVHFAPEWEATLDGASEISLTRSGTRVVIHVVGDVSCSLHRGESDPPLGWNASRFNQVVPSWTLRLRADRSVAPQWQITFIPD